MTTAHCSECGTEVLWGEELCSTCQMIGTLTRKSKEKSHIKNKDLRALSRELLADDVSVKELDRLVRKFHASCKEDGLCTFCKYQDDLTIQGSICDACDKWDRFSRR